MSLIMQYLAPVLVAVAIIAFVVGNVAVISVTMILALINPMFLIALIPIIAADVGLVIAFLIGAAILLIIYWYFYLKNIGVLALIPVGGWILGFLIGLLPYVGGLLSTLASFFPWMAFASIVHWWSYRGALDVANI
jgi:hypothetical protein